MNKVIVVLLALLVCATLAFAGDTAAEQNLTQTEKLLWEGWKNHDSAPFKKVMADRVEMAQAASGMEINCFKDMGSTDCTVTSYSLDTPAFKWIDKNTVLMV